MKTLVISEQDVPSLLPMSELIRGIKEAYIAYSGNKTVKPQRITAQINDTSIVVNCPGYLPGSSMFTVKVNTKVPQNSACNLPFLRGTIQLVDHTNGQLLAIMDSGLITAMRTGAAGAIGVECLANPEDGVVALIGAGVQAEWQVKALHSIGRVSEVIIYDILQSQSGKLAEKLSIELHLPVRMASTLQDAIHESQIIITTTPSKTPVLTVDMLRPGLHINAFGADQPGKVEIDADIIKNSLVVVDDYPLALSNGALNIVYSLGKLDANQKIFEIGNVLSASRNVRCSNQEITLFGNVGLAFQDLVACSIIYHNALKFKHANWVTI